MLARIFVTLCRLPGFKKKLWRAWYEYLAGSLRTPEWTFMNYGYAPSDGRTLALRDTDEAERQCIQLYEHVAGAVDLSGCSVLEVGSGRGGGSSFIKRYLGAQRMTGVDLSKNAVEFSRATHRVDGLEFRVGDAENLPFNDGAFDAVVNVESSHCYPSFEKFLSEVRRVVRPGGHFLYADFRDRKNVDSWRSTLRASGLTMVRETTITENVVASLNRDNDRKLELIHRLVPSILRRSIFNFAGVRGSALYESMRTGELVYMSFVLRKSPNFSD